MSKKIQHIMIVTFFDAMIIYFSYALAILLRFDFSIDKITTQYKDMFFHYAPVAIILTIAIFFTFRMYSFVWRFVSLRESLHVVLVVILSNFACFFLSLCLNSRFPISVYFMVFLIQILLILLLRFSVKLFTTLMKMENKKSHQIDSKKTMIIGAGSAGEMLLKDIIISKHISLNVCCFIDDNRDKIGKAINGIRIYGNRNKIPEAITKYGIETVIFAIPSALARDRKAIISICQEFNCELKIVPGVFQMLNDEVRMEHLRNVEIEDLLDREAIKIDLNGIMDYVTGETVLVTGGGGSIGSEICRQIASFNPRQLIVFDIYENNTYEIQLELVRDYPKLDLHVLIGSVRDRARVNDLFETYKPDIVFHAAAHKHVPLMEDSPNESIKNNVFGTYNVAMIADKYKTKKMVLISSDKAVNPTNIMGASKRLCEMVIQYYSRKSKTEFVAVRFGNVLGSNGSVIPIFKRQIASGGPVTVMHRDIIRYFMTIPEAVSLVLQAGAYARGGEIFVLDMGDPVSIDALAKNLIKLSGFVPNEDIMIEYTGLRPGEKLYEELLMDEENMKKTDNNQIFIGSPIEFSDKEFESDLAFLFETCSKNSPNIKECVAKIIPTYKPYNSKL